MQTIITLQQETADRREITVTAPVAAEVADDLLELVAGGEPPDYNHPTYCGNDCEDYWV